MSVYDRISPSFFFMQKLNQEIVFCSWLAQSWIILRLQSGAPPAVSLQSLPRPLHRPSLAARPCDHSQHYSLFHCLSLQHQPDLQLDTHRSQLQVQILQNHRPLRGRHNSHPLAFSLQLSPLSFFALNQTVCRLAHPKSSLQGYCSCLPWLWRSIFCLLF